MRIITVTALVILTLLTAFADGADKGPIELVEAYKTALSEHSIAPLEGRLSREFDFAGAGPEISKLVLKQVIGMGVLDMGEITDVRVEVEGDRATVYITGIITAGGNEQEAEDNFDAVFEDGAWKISALGKGVLQALIIDDPTKDMGFTIEGPPKTVLRFPPEQDHIIVHARLSDGAEANFIVDNGTPLSVINAKFVDSFEPVGDVAAAKAMGVSGEIGQTGAVRVDGIEIGKLEVANLTALTMDLSHLSAALGIEITGLLGTDFLARFAWTLDYSSRRLILNRLDENGDLIEEDAILSVRPAHTIGFERTLHLLYTTARFAHGVSANIVLDCGAGGGVITPEFFERIPENSFETGECDTLIGADGKRSLVEAIIPNRLELGPIERGDYAVVISDLSHINSMGLPTPVDGIIGYNFFSDWLVTTRYDRNIIELRPIPK